MPLLNYTTEKKAEQTIAEIQKLLSRYNVSAMMTEYDGPNVSGVSFRIDYKGQQMSYKLPCNWRSVKEIFVEKNANRKHVAGRLERRIDTDDEHVINVAWRIIKDWMEAQLALVEINMATIPQIFLPYTIMKDGRTLADHVETNPGFLLGNGK